MDQYKFVLAAVLAIVQRRPLRISVTLFLLRDCKMLLPTVVVFRKDELIVIISANGSLECCRFRALEEKSFQIRSVTYR
jgi:hypothetical protein